MTAKEQKQVENIMRLLNCTEEEARDVIATDRMIDKGERSPYDLPIDQEKAALRIANMNERKSIDKKGNTKPTMRGKVRAENLTKSGIITELFTFLNENCTFECENVEIANKERMITFKVGENNFDLTLIQKRKPKK